MHSEHSKRQREAYVATGNTQSEPHTNVSVHAFVRYLWEVNWVYSAPVDFSVFFIRIVATSHREYLVNIWKAKPMTQTDRETDEVSERKRWPCLSLHFAKKRELNRIFRVWLGARDCSAHFVFIAGNLYVRQVPPKTQCTRTEHVDTHSHARNTEQKIVYRSSDEHYGNSIWLRLINLRYQTHVDVCFVLCDPPANYYK